LNCYALTKPNNVHNNVHIYNNVSALGYVRLCVM
jgi:hypothetical protein